MTALPTALIADDEPLLLLDLRKRLETLWPDLDIVAEASNGQEALRILQTEKPSIAFLDIRMPGLTGIEVATRAAEQGLKTFTVFVTAYDDQAVTAFEQNAVDYVMKPVSTERLTQTINRVKGRLQDDESVTALMESLYKLAGVGGETLRWIRASVGKGIRMIPVEDVCYFSAADKYVAVTTADGESLIRTPLKDLLPRLDPDIFQQIHRSIIVNLREVDSVMPDGEGHLLLKLRNRPETLPVARAYAALFRPE